MPSLPATAGRLERVEHANGVVTYRSPLLAAAGVLHAFSTRIGGVSTGRCASLNLAVTALGERVDEPERVAENHRRLRHALKLDPHSLHRVAQVHGARVLVAEGEPDRVRPEADAIVSRDPNALCAVHVADCVPVLVARADGRAVAAVHAGWRGLAAGVVERAVEALVRLHAEPPGELVAAVGPAISLERFEVGSEVEERFAALGFSGAIATRAGSKARVDLPEIAAACLERAGLRRARIDRCERCTHRDADEFFSHRRAGGPTGRQAAWIAAR